MPEENLSPFELPAAHPLARRSTARFMRLTQVLLQASACVIEPNIGRGATRCQRQGLQMLGSFTDLEVRCRMEHPSERRQCVRDPSPPGASSGVARGLEVDSRGHRLGHHPGGQHDVGRRSIGEERKRRALRGRAAREIGTGPSGRVQPLEMVGNEAQYRLA